LSTTSKPEVVWFTTKGQVVIPSRLRREYHIEEGTKAVVTATADGILLKPVTKWSIERARGIARRTPGGKPLASEWAEHKAEEHALEEGKYGRSTGGRSR
jgi:AbrB family looped-hinge helix DNA binding protein